MMTIRVLPLHRQRILTILRCPNCLHGASLLRRSTLEDVEEMAASRIVYLVECQWCGEEFALSSDFTLARLP